MEKIDQVLEVVSEKLNSGHNGITAKEVSTIMDIDRSTASKYLNKLCKKNELTKTNSRPVKFYLFNQLYDKLDNDSIENFNHDFIAMSNVLNNNDSIIKSNPLIERNFFNKLLGYDRSLRFPLEKAKAALIYPPRGIHTLLIGENGVGKTYFINTMIEYAKINKIVNNNTPFITINCADYIDHPNLLNSKIFGICKDNYNNLNTDEDGVLKIANGGFLILEEAHYLSSYTQDMIFSYIEKGFFHPLGSGNKPININTRIVFTSTESFNSPLLEKFIQRVPMLISLPSLSSKSLDERYDLIEYFILKESEIIGKQISISSDSISSLLLYECDGNISQLKNDIQISCANAFLNYKSHKSKVIYISKEEIPNHVRKGMLNLPKYRNQIIEIMKNKSNTFIFDGSKGKTVNIEFSSTDFYDNLEDKFFYLKKMGMTPGQIRNVLNMNIESSFYNYIISMSENLNEEIFDSSVSPKIKNLVNTIMDMANDYFKRSFDNKIYYGLCLHLEKSINRIKKGKNIYNPRLDAIRKYYVNSFIFSMKIAELIDSEFNIITPVDEIGYLSMFFTENFLIKKEYDHPKVKVIIAMHGESTATSMANTVNTLITNANVTGIDMPLEAHPKDYYDIIKNKVIELNEGPGVFLCVDMGSLNQFSHMIKDETGIPVESISMISTLSAINVAEKALFGYSLKDLKNCDFNSMTNDKFV